MKPIEYKADMEFLQGMRCVEYRVPAKDGFRGDGFLLALALRYGLIGAATSHHLLVTADLDDQPFVIGTIGFWSEMVEQHLRFEMKHKLPQNDPRDIPDFVARWAAEPVQHSIPLYRRMCPLETVLEVAVDDFMVTHSGLIKKGWPWWQRRRAMREFAEDAKVAVRYALNYFERRQLGLDEVPEIALLGE